MKEKPCHYSFTFTETKPEGGSITCLYLEAKTTADIPRGATEIRALNEGDVVYEAETAFGVRRVVHSHAGQKRESPLEAYNFIGISEEIHKSLFDHIMTAVTDYLDGVHK